MINNSQIIDFKLLTRCIKKNNNQIIKLITNYGLTNLTILTDNSNEIRSKSHQDIHRNKSHPKIHTNGIKKFSR